MAISKLKKLAPERRAAYLLGVVVAVIGGVLLLSPGREIWHAKGPFNTGHTKLECGDCHTPAPGNFIGQAFGNLAHAVGLTDSARFFVYAPAGNEQCLDCHDDPDNVHIVDDFLKPEFAKVREARGVQFCTGCHQQHLGVRVSATPRVVCQDCHDDMDLADDPVDIPHTRLISDQRWETCLGCHDHHGNHDREVPIKMSEILTEEQIQQYFDGGKSPYGYRRLTVIQTMRNSMRD